MNNNSSRYEHFKEAELTLRDELAIDRTRLANDRTFLAFGRTALTLFIAGVTALHFLASEGLWWSTLGWLFTLGGPFIFWLGLNRYKATLALITRGEEHVAEAAQAASATPAQWSAFIPDFPSFGRKSAQEAKAKSDTPSL
jgi:putative membrane protein